MYGMNQYEVWRQRPQELRQEVAAYRLEKAARANRGRESTLVRDLSWELARYLDTAGFPASSTAITEHRKRSKR